MDFLKMPLHKKIFYVFFAIIALAELIFMLFNAEMALIGNIVMLVFCIPDTIISQLRNKEEKHFDLAFAILYVLLICINILILMIR